jgi:hypothetical protein
MKWSKRAIARTTPILLGLFSLVMLIADRLVVDRAMPVRTRAGYRKTQPTFSEALARVRHHIWRTEDFSTSRSQTNLEKTPNPLLARCMEVLCYAA